MSFLLWLQELRTPALDAVFSAVTHLGDQAVIVALLCALLWCVDREAGLKIALVFFLGGITCQMLKLIVMMPRPWVLDPRVIPVESALEAATGWSLPSGHTASTVALYGGLLLWSKRRWHKALCALIIALVAFSRMYLGVHTPLDVLAALGIGIALLAFSWYALGRAERNPRLYGWVLGVSLALALATLAVVGVRYAQGQPGGMLLDAEAAAGAGLGFLWGWWLLRRHNARFGVRAAWYFQAAKLAVGLAVIALIQMLAGEGWVTHLLAYHVLALFAVAAYPLLAENILKKIGA